ncbi:MAG: DUF4129 domain-containing protein [Ferruginibacter sp.]|nr:DUF4129 domain-containing protein [Cytophagales bacterium]
MVTVAATPKPDSLVVQKDRSRVDVRRFGADKLARYERDKDFQYDRRRTDGPLSAWERFRLWLIERVFGFLFRPGSAVYWEWAIYIGSGLVICYVILKLTQGDLRGLFFGEARATAPDHESADENIHELDFDRLIEEAIARQHYRRAVRLFYLQSLKQLTDRRLIDWRINKTNQDYLAELSRSEAYPSVEPAFRRLTALFEYICYGNFAVRTADFEEMRLSFQRFNRDVARLK